MLSMSKDGGLLGTGGSEGPEGASTSTRSTSAREIKHPLRKSQRSTASTIFANELDEEKAASEIAPRELDSGHHSEVKAEQPVSSAPSSYSARKNDDKPNGGPPEPPPVPKTGQECAPPRSYDAAVR